MANGHLGEREMVSVNTIPKIIQGGMGAAVSDWRLARAVSSHGQLGVVSGTALDSALARRLEIGDPGGHMRRALAAFPLQDIARRIIDKYYIEGGKADDARFAAKTMVSDRSSRKTEELIVAANFVEVFLAKEGHSNPVGINFLEKIQVPTLPSLYGVMLAGVDYVLALGSLVTEAAGRSEGPLVKPVVSTFVQRSIPSRTPPSTT